MSERNQLIQDEGLRLTPYRCTAGKWTIGVGRNLEDNPLSVDEINDLLYSRPHLQSSGMPVEALRKLLFDDFHTNGITRREAMMLLDNDINRITQQLKSRLLWYQSAPSEVRDILLNMAFNMGIGSLMTFGATLPLIRDGRYLEASENLKKSKWASQVPNRAGRLINRLSKVK